MELSEWAERIVTATSMEEKLADPGPCTDLSPVFSGSLPLEPGRPTGLHFKRVNDREGSFPGIHRIQNEEDRGRLLHFFANHELLATELMALVLLRFPEAPAAFRAGVARTLRDEQKHTRWYMNRMAELGIHFGDLPVSGYFWRAVSTMESPMDFVSRLSLTFEQANLDFCRQFGQLFHSVGDVTSAGILDRIYRDEIAHVAHGLKWFRRWKNSDESDWNVFCRQLKFPLSPARARGISFNEEGRQAAGLSPEFIESLRVAAQSKGRTPTVWWFNPFAEGYLARGRAFTPAKAQLTLLHDLAHLPQFMARTGDVVLCSHLPSLGHQTHLLESGFDLPEWIQLPAEPGTLPPTWLERKLGAFRPWAWSPDSLEIFDLMRAQLSDSKASRPDDSLGWQILYSKAWSCAFLSRWLPQWTEIPSLSPLELVGQTVTTAGQAWEAIRHYRSLGHHRLVVKQAFGMAGDQSLRLWEPEMLPNQRDWIERVLEKGGELVIEPWLERVFDFSVQLEMGNHGLRIVGYTELLCDHRGQYHGNRTRPDCGRRLPAMVRRSCPKHGPTGTAWENLFEHLRQGLESEFFRLGFRGPAGVDAFLYRDAVGDIRLKPIVELNPRHTMGRVALELHRYVAPGCSATFRILRLNDLQRDGYSTVQQYANELRQKRPIRKTGHPHPQIAEGAVCLNDPLMAEKYIVVWEVGREIRSGTECVLA